MSTHLILTVGTGTAGRHSNLAAGLRRTLELLSPEKFWLVPSTDEVSQLTADLVRDGMAGFQPWADDAPYRSISLPDSLDDCRQAVREVILRARLDLPEAGRLLVNPTSGTKQMSVGAALAALDEGVGELTFTVGQRADGVVMTGTEVMETFDASGYFEERDLGIAEALFQAGAFWAAARILQNGRSPRSRTARAKALCMHEWQRLNHAEAARQAAKFSSGLADRLESLAAADAISLELLRDVLAGADELSRWGDADEALARYYRGAELAAKVILSEALGIRPRGGADNYARKDFNDRLPEGHPMLMELEQRSRGGGVSLGMDLAWRLLAALGHPAGRTFLANGTLRNLLDKRNEGYYGHGNRSASRREVETVRSELRRVFEEGYPVAAVWGMSDRIPGLREQ